MAALAVTSCKVDNLTPPKSILSGRVVYQGTPIGVRSNAPSQLELWQRGFANFVRIPVNVAFDGSYSTLLFDGDYLLVRTSVSPWLPQTDSIKVRVAGNTTVDVPVTPYFLVNSATYTKGTGNISATINVTKVNATSTLEAVRLYISKTKLLDQLQNDGIASVAGGTVTPGTPFTATVTIPTQLANADAVYVRVGVKTTGVTELAYSAPTLLQLK
jgi:hypothetical protein